jgi:hypothetical protein
MLKRILTASLCFVSLSSLPVLAMQVRHADESAPDRGGSTVLQCKFGYVERAGVAIVKDYGASTPSPALRFSVLVAADVHRTKNVNNLSLPYVNFFAGGCEKKDQHSTVTAIEELYEETAKAINLPSSSLQYGNDPNYSGYVYSGDFSKPNTQGKNYTQLFFYRMDRASVTDINTAMAAAAVNHQLSKRFKETNQCYAIPLQDLLDRARMLQKLEASGQYAQVQDDNNYVFYTRGNGDGSKRTMVFLDPQYTRNLARDITRDPSNFQRICRDISGGVVQ